MRRKRPLARSSSDDITRGCRSKLLGVSTTSGLRQLRFTCRRRQWKYWAGVEGQTICMLSSAAKAQKSLQPGAGMLGTLAFEGVRQKQHQAAQPPPLVFGTDDELIDDHLGRVDEVAVLGLPQDERLRGNRASSRTRSPWWPFRRAGC